MTKLVHLLVGYDRVTEKVKLKLAIPSDHWDEIKKRLLHPDKDDPSMVDAYQIDETTARKVMIIIRESPRPDLADVIVQPDLDYFIEGSKANAEAL